MTQKRRPPKKAKKPTQKAAKPNVQKIAESLEQEFNKTVTLVPLPDGSIAYKNYYVKENKQGRWTIYSKTCPDPQGEFNLKSCALIAAKALSKLQLELFNEVKLLDSRYWANRTTVEICQKQIGKIKDLDHYIIMLNKLEHSQWLVENCKSEISKRFHWSFV